MGGSELLNLHIAFVHPVFVRNPLESAFVGDHFGVCFMNIDQIIPELCMHKDEKVPYKHNYGDKLLRIFLWRLWHRGYNR